MKSNVLANDRGDQDDSFDSFKDPSETQNERGLGVQGLWNEDEKENLDGNEGTSEIISKPLQEIKDDTKLEA